MDYTGPPTSHVTLDKIGVLAGFHFGFVLASKTMDIGLYEIAG